MMVADFRFHLLIALVILLPPLTNRSTRVAYATMDGIDDTTAIEYLKSRLDDAFPPDTRNTGKVVCAGCDRSLMTNTKYSHVCHKLKAWARDRLSAKAELMEQPVLKQPRMEPQPTVTTPPDHDVPEGRVYVRRHMFDMLATFTIHMHMN